jgi:four helix bundle protein
MNYKDLDIWKLANEVVIEIHFMTINELPSYELYETGSQIRRSSKSVKSNIVEGYGRRQSKKEFLHFLIIAQASNDETIDHMNTLYITGSLRDKNKYDQIMEDLVHLGKKLNAFITAVRKQHMVRQ